MDTKKPVSHYMTKNVISVDYMDRFLDVIQLMREQHIGCVLIKKDKEFIGIFTERDFLTKPDFLNQDHYSTE